MSERGEIRALRQVTSELRDEPPPELDWARVERAFDAELERTPTVSRRRQGWRLGLVAVAAAAALYWTIAPSSPNSKPTGGGAPLAAAPAIDGDALEIGTPVEAAAEPLRVEHDRWASWTLSPGGRARLVSRGRWLTVSLETGSLRAEVTPGQAPEAFAVEVDGARVAVHGTVFTVSRADGGLDVQVERGAVVVGRGGARGSTRGTIVRAPERGAFTPLGAPRPLPSPESAAAVRMRPSPAARPLPRPAVAASAPATAAPPARARPGELESAIYGVAATVRRCFAKHTPAPRDGQVTADVTFTVTVAPDGSVAGLTFTPPLAPAVTECSFAAVQSTALPAPGAETRIEHTVSLFR